MKRSMWRSFAMNDKTFLTDVLPHFTYAEFDVFETFADIRWFVDGAAVQLNVDWHENKTHVAIVCVPTNLKKPIQDDSGWQLKTNAEGVPRWHWPILVTDANFLRYVLPSWTYDSFRFGGGRGAGGLRWLVSPRGRNDVWCDDPWCEVIRVFDGLTIRITAYLGADFCDFMFDAPALRCSENWGIDVNARRTSRPDQALFDRCYVWAAEIDGSGYIVPTRAFPLNADCGRQAEYVARNLRTIGASW